jgi:hypothetical protein
VRGTATGPDRAEHRYLARFFDTGEVDSLELP